MPYNLLMPEREQRSLRPSWLPPWLWQRRWWIALATLFILVWWLVPPLLYRHTGTGKAEKLKAITDTRTAMLAGLIGVGALLTFWVNSRVYRITVQGHITERYTKAIEQLGHTELAIRLGGVYALERIAVDSERDHPTVVEVLSAFAREGSSKQGTRRAEQGTAQEAAKTDTPAPTSDATPRPATDIQAALSVLGRLPERPDIPRADLSEAQLSDAQLGKANLSGAGLNGANLSGAMLYEADLSSAKLQGADLSGAWLEGVNLSGAILYEADLSAAQLQGADLSGAILHRVNLSDAWLGGADLRNTGGLTQAQLDAANGNARTQLPDGLRRPGSWTATTRQLRVPNEARPFR
jgi:pentapeptide repeat protein